MLPAWEMWCQASSLGISVGKEAPCLMWESSLWVLGGTSCILLVLLYELALGKIVFMLMAFMVTQYAKK